MLYFMAKEYHLGLSKIAHRLENMPRSDWPLYKDNDDLANALRRVRSERQPHWAELSPTW